MGTRIYGIGAAQNPDNIGETIFLDGLDISKLHALKDEHPLEPRFLDFLGSVDYAKKIYSEKDCENEKQLRCWRSAQVPFLYAEGELADDQEHPDALAAASLLKFCEAKGNTPLNIGWSIDGAILERKDQAGNFTENKETGKNLTKTAGYALSLTVKPCNPKCKVFLENDLTKSDMNMSAPASYFEALKKSPSKTSITENQWFLLHAKTETLKKSLDDYLSGFTSMKCYNCGESIRFFKATKNMPNVCNNCGHHHSLQKIWKALNK